MKKYVKKLFMALAFVSVLILPTQQAHAGIFEIIKQILIKAIKAADLQVQRKQNKVLDLQNAQKKLENSMAKQKLNDISDWTKKQKEQYQQYFDELKKVKAVIRDYQRVKDIMQMQLRITNEYSRVWQLLRKDKNFTLKELQYMASIYSNILKQTLQNVKQLNTIITSNTTQMSDGKRIEIANTIGEDVQRNFDDLRRFNASNIRLSLSRTNTKEDADRVRTLYGIEKSR